MAVTNVTGLVLAGGRGTRMGGVDKGLQNHQGTPLALHALLRLQLQQGQRLAGAMVNANRNLAAYEAFGVPVWPDSLDGYAGPLAGFLTGLEHCNTSYLLTVPCDCPLYPLDLLERLAQALEQHGAEIAMAAAPEGGAGLRPQPVFCLLRVDLLESLVRYTQAGGRKIDAWTAQHATVLVPFDQPGDDPRAFCNANTPQELRALAR
ncbi:molybdenum cofactor guanylyltransferase MobA [Aquabacterium sp. A08]|uniref:molybdenum cofactor guanylyltransferase MobA n=1 Tax=Aquabacterium sp. A08 TaxID=2718532 RepID=UPI0014204181|nr:molybdenum cofactor guanylyltransferase MobA [Aquabacterium sp. A08]NIC40334.1 molybdenum cofactor guanylyltransferase MobA [Aquabacterium sp. A08]